MLALILRRSAPLPMYACGLRNASISVCWSRSPLSEVQVVVQAIDRVGQHRVAEAIDRVRELGHDRRVEVGELVLKTKGSTIGWMRRANSSNTRCWYCISVTKRAAWNRRSPSHTSVHRSSAWSAVGTVDRASHSLRNATSVEPAAARIVALLASTSRLCSEWKMVWTVVRRDVLVAAAVAGDEVRVEHLVVVGAGHRRRRRRRDRYRRSDAFGVVGRRRDRRSRRRVVRDVVEEGVAGAAWTSAVHDVPAACLRCTPVGSAMPSASGAMTICA